MNTQTELLFSIGSVFLGTDFFPKGFFLYIRCFPAPCIIFALVFVMSLWCFCGCFVFAGVHNDAVHMCS